MFVASRTDFPSEARTGSTISIFWEKRKSRASFFMSGSRPKKVWGTPKIRAQRGDPERKYTLMGGFSSTTTRRHTRRNSMGSFSMFLHTAIRVVRSCEQMKIKNKRNCINDFLYYVCFLCFFFYSNIWIKWFDKWRMTKFNFLVLEYNKKNPRFIYKFKRSKNILSKTSKNIVWKTFVMEAPKASG